MHDRSHLHLPANLGQRAADVVADAVGSWGFIGGYLILTAVWMGGNASGVVSFDRYPFIAYTCTVSVLAILMSSLILLSQNRQAVKDRKRDDHEAAEVSRHTEMLERQAAQGNAQHREILACLALLNKRMQRVEQAASKEARP